MRGFSLNSAQEPGQQLLLPPPPISTIHRPADNTREERTEREKKTMWGLRQKKYLKRKDGERRKADGAERRRRIMTLTRIDKARNHILVVGG